MQRILFSDHKAVAVVRAIPPDELGGFIIIDAPREVAKQWVGKPLTEAPTELVFDFASEDDLDRMIEALRRVKESLDPDAGRESAVKALSEIEGVKTLNVWSNGKTIRRFQGQGAGYKKSPEKGYARYQAILIPHKEDAE